MHTLPSGMLYDPSFRAALTIDHSGRRYIGALTCNPKECGILNDYAIVCSGRGMMLYLKAGDTCQLNGRRHSGYEAYDRLSPALKVLLEGLTAEHDGNFFHEVSRRPRNSSRGRY